MRASLSIGQLVVIEKCIVYFLYSTLKKYITAVRRHHFQNSKWGELRLENLHEVSTQNLSENIEKK